VSAFIEHQAALGDHGVLNVAVGQQKLGEQFSCRVLC
jgi:hypothetical protein